MRIIADSHIPYVKEYFNSYGELILKPGRLINSTDVQDATILLVRSITQVNQKLLENSAVKFVGSITSGTDHLDIKWLDKAGISWSSAAGFNAASVADYIISCIAGLQNQGTLNQGKIKAGIIGVGKVGTLVAERFNFLEFDVELCDPIRASNEKTFVSTPLENLENLDVISLHVPLTRNRKNSTYHFINQEILQKQLPHCVLINASRGAVIKTQDLLAFGKHLKWCFDVWENEPKINKQVLNHALIATPHIAGYSSQSKLRGIDMIYKSAIEKKIIQPQALTPVEFTYQELPFNAMHQKWQDVVLDVFNPLKLTTTMKNKLLDKTVHGNIFDEMRHEFISRQEFAYTKIAPQHLPKRDQEILTQLKFII